MNTQPIHDIGLVTRAILDGDFTDYDSIVTNMIKRYPPIQPYIDNLGAVDTRVDLDRYVRQELIPSVETACTLANSMEWISLMQTRIIGAY